MFFIYVTSLIIIWWKRWLQASTSVRRRWFYVKI